MKLMNPFTYSYQIYRYLYIYYIYFVIAVGKLQNLRTICVATMDNIYDVGTSHRLFVVICNNNLANVAMLRLILQQNRLFNK